MWLILKIICCSSPATEPTFKRFKYSDLILNPDRLCKSEADCFIFKENNQKITEQPESNERSIGFNYDRYKKLLSATENLTTNMNVLKVTNTSNIMSRYKGPSKRKQNSDECASFNNNIAKPSINIRNLLFEFINTSKITVENYRFLYSCPINEFVSIIKSNMFSDKILNTLFRKLIKIDRSGLSVIISKCKWEIEYRKLNNLEYNSLFLYLKNNAINEIAFVVLKDRIETLLLKNFTNIIKLAHFFAAASYENIEFKNELVNILYKTIQQTSTPPFNPNEIFALIISYIKRSNYQYIKYLIEDPSKFQVALSNEQKIEWLRCITSNRDNHADSIKLFFEYNLFDNNSINHNIMLLESFKIREPTTENGSEYIEYLHPSVDELFNYLDITEYTFSEFIEIVKIYSFNNCEKLDLFLNQFIEKYKGLESEQKIRTINYFIENKKFNLISKIYNSIISSTSEPNIIHDALADISKSTDVKIIQQFIFNLCAKECITKYTIIRSIVILLESNIPQGVDYLLCNMKLNQVENISCVSTIASIVVLFVSYKQPEYIAYFINIINQKQLINYLNISCLTKIFKKFHEITSSDKLCNNFIEKSKPSLLFNIYFIEFMKYNFAINKEMIESICRNEYFELYMTDARRKILLNLLINNKKSMLRLIWILKSIKSNKFKFSFVCETIVILIEKKKISKNFKKVFYLKFIKLLKGNLENYSLNGNIIIEFSILHKLVREITCDKLIDSFI